MKVVGIKFKNGGKIYYFAPKAGDKYEKGMPVVVETSKALEFAYVEEPEKEVEDNAIVTPLKPYRKGRYRQAISFRHGYRFGKGQSSYGRYCRDL